MPLTIVNRNFRGLRDKGHLKRGLLSHVFLYATSESRDSWKLEGRYYPWIWAVDPDWPLDGADEDGYDGRVPVAWGITYDRFYNFISTRRFSLKDIWRDLNHMRELMADEPQPGWGFTKLR